jgi:hypothetical protein
MSAENENKESKLEDATICKDDKKECFDDSGDEDISDEDEVSSDEGSLLPILSLKDNSTIYVINVDGFAKFYANTIKEARERMWDLAKVRRFQATNYNSYIRACSDKNRIEVVGSYKMTIFSVDKTICWLNISKIQQIENINSDNNEESEVCDPVPEMKNSPRVVLQSKTGFFW